MNIVQVARRFAVNDWGGMETVIIETSKQLIRMGHRTEILCTLATANSKSDNVEGVPVRRVPYFYPYFGLREEAKRILDRKGGSPFSFTMLQALKRYPNLDLIHLHAGGRLGGIGRHVAQKRRIPYVVSLHGAKFDVPPEEAASWTAPTRGTIEWGKVLGWWVGARQVLHDAAAILCVGHRDSVLAQQKLPQKRVVYLPNGVDADRFAAGDGSGFRARHGIPPKALVMLTAARIDVQKNQHFVARVLPGLARICPEVHALIIGHVTNEAYYEELVKLIASRNMQSRATIIRGLAGRSQELVDAYHAADLFVLPSIHEPFGIVILEAWASGLPVIASSVGGIPTFVEHDVDGMLFRPGDERAFLDAFRALSTRERRETMARAGQRKAIEEYSWDKITERLVGIYEEALRENPLRK
jgi:glycosyltransferase involved in cell wall biosynthesis